MTYPDVPRPLRRQPYMGGPCDLLPPRPPIRRHLIKFKGGPNEPFRAQVDRRSDEPYPAFFGYVQSKADPDLYIWGGVEHTSRAHEHESSAGGEA